MKKKKKLTLCALFMCVATTCATLSSQNTSTSFNVLLEETEALSMCEVKVPIFGYVFKCDGEKTCSETYNDYELICDGTKIK